MRFEGQKVPKTEDWNKEGTKEGHINHPKRSSYPVTTEDQKRLQRDTPAHTELQAPINDFMRCQFANRDTSKGQHVDVDPGTQSGTGCENARDPCSTGACDLSQLDDSRTLTRLWSSSSSGARATWINISEMRC